MKKGGTLFLKATLVVMGLVTLALCIFFFPSVGKGLSAEFPAVPYFGYVVVVAYATAVGVLLALWQSWMLLNLIDKSNAFSGESVKALKNIKYAAISVSALWFTLMPHAFGVAETDDAPGLIIIALFVALAPLVVAVFAAALQKLVQNAIDMKSEIDLTV